MERHREELAAIEALDNGELLFTFLLSCAEHMFPGKTYDWAFGTDVAFAIDVIKYFAGWADKITGQTIEVRFLNFRACRSHKSDTLVDR